MVGTLFLFFSEAFVDLGALQMIYLENNRLSSLPDNFCRNLNSLQYIDLNHNNPLNMTSSNNPDISVLKNCS